MREERPTGRAAPRRAPASRAPAPPPPPLPAPPPSPRTSAPASSRCGPWCPPPQGPGAHSAQRSAAQCSTACKSYARKGAQTHKVHTIHTVGRAHTWAQRHLGSGGRGHAELSRRSPTRRAPQGSPQHMLSTAQRAPRAAQRAQRSTHQQIQQPAQLGLEQRRRARVGRLLAPLRLPPRALQAAPGPCGGVVTLATRLLLHLGACPSSLASLAGPTALSST